MTPEGPGAAAACAVTAVPERPPAESLGTLIETAVIRVMNVPEVPGKLVDGPLERCRTWWVGQVTEPALRESFITDNFREFLDPVEILLVRLEPPLGHLIDGTAGTAGGRPGCAVLR